MEERIDLVVLERKQRSGGISLAVVISLILHAVLLILFIRSYRAAKPQAESVPMARYVELIQQNPREHVEAPGPKADQAPLTAPLSDANRKASMPEPTGDQPTQRPGDGGGLYTPPMSPRPRAPQQMANPPQAMEGGHPVRPEAGETPAFQYREPSKAAAATGAVDWKNAIREIGKVASLGGAGLDIGQLGGGEKGFAEAGPLSFETQWYDWGPYAQSMVSKIRVNWYENMPQIIRTGMAGQVTIRFTIQRDGRITNIETLRSSGIPPYDFAAKKAIELSSPLNPLPKDFPNPSERVTCMFFYNMEIPR
ncbi:MAG TPA: TonB family protein [Thermoanaerobaculia bacterium]|nr:TonB family protein [Thermoanaerobaculia bacterium]